MEEIGIEKSELKQSYGVFYFTMNYSCFYLNNVGINYEILTGVENNMAYVGPED